MGNSSSNPAASTAYPQISLWITVGIACPEGAFKSVGGGSLDRSSIKVKIFITYIFHKVKQYT
jgi:hypothetical protein